MEGSIGDLLDKTLRHLADGKIDEARRCADFALGLWVKENKTAPGMVSGRPMTNTEMSALLQVLFTRGDRNGETKV